MKTLYLNRHAKSSWDDTSLSDFDRPLNNRGRRDVPLMSKILRSKIQKPDLIYSSPAKRAISTAVEIAKAFGYPKENIVQEIKIYDASISDLMRIINNTSEVNSTIMIFGHNPTFTMTSNYLSDKYIDNIPTSGFVQIEFECKKWSEIEGKTGKLVLFEYPKKYIK